IAQFRYNNGAVLVAITGQGDLIWSQECGTNYASGMTIFRYQATGNLVLHTGSELRNLADGLLIRDRLEPAAAVDLNQDSIVEIITPNGIYNQNVEAVTTRNTEVGTVSGPPFVKDLDGDLIPEIVLLSSTGLYVFRSDYSLWWQDNSYQFQAPYCYYDRIYQPRIACADINQDRIQELFFRSFFGSFDDYGPLQFTTTCYQGNGIKLWTTTGSFEPYEGLANPALIDINNDQKLELLFANGAFTLEVFEAATGQIMYRKPLLDYYASVPPVTGGDIDGDQRTEVLVANLCIDAIDQPVQSQTILSPAYESEAHSLILTTPYSVVTSDGVLWIAGIQGVTYFDPASGNSGLIPVANTNGEKPILRLESSSTIGLWSEVRKIQYGTITTLNRNYQATNQADPNFKYRNPRQINGQNFYYLARQDNGAQALWIEDLNTGAQQQLLESTYIERILGFPDSENMLVSFDSGRLVLLNLNSLSFREILNHIG
ncbi:MAG TPA: hypothetical protein VEC37_17535, partial [Bacillota bacterium]|nr:hypothetical protein [Bacillota bacterium]